VDQFSIDSPARCVTIAGPPTPPPPPPGPHHPLGKPTVAIAKDDVDIYNSPVGPRNRVIGMMAQGERAKILGHHQFGWTNVQVNRPLNTSPGGAGWVADDHLTMAWLCGNVICGI
jgi:hypothetical protein